MKTVKGYPVCDGCIFSSLHLCDKFQEPCTSFFLKGKRYQIACLSCLKNDSYTFGEKIKTNQIDKIGYLHLPGPENLEYYKSFIMMRKFYPEAFYENRQIFEIYGDFPGAIWNGRTPNFGGPTMTIQQINEIKNEIESLGISINLTWNNHLVSGTDVYDRFCNAITEIFHNGKHSITVASMELFNYLKEKYPNYTYYQSVITTTEDKEFTKKDERFDMYLWNRNLNNNWEHLLKVPEEERNTIEFLCNDACTPICKRMGHYNQVNACLLNRSDESSFNCSGYCTIDHDFIHYNARTWPVTIKPEDLDEYIENGFIHFKLCSRGDAPSILMLKMAQYLAKPEYVMDVFTWAINKVYLPEDYLSPVASQKELR